MFHYIFILTILFFLAISLATSTPTQFPPKGDGFTALLIPPLSPRSPYYSHILAANNLSTTLTNITLDRTHYQKWVQTQNSASPNAYSPITFFKNHNSHVMQLYIGNPPQVVYAIFDTGSNIVWFKCEGVPGESTFFAQSKSSSYNTIDDCTDETMCIKLANDMSCPTGAEDGPCVFDVKYVSNDYGKGNMALDHMRLVPDGDIMDDFKFGCSTDYHLSIAGIIGASYMEYSLPMQIYPGNPQFSYCMSSNLDIINLIKFGNDATLVGQPVKFFRNNIRQHYYMDVIGLQVNGKDIKVRPSVFKMSSDGYSGVFLDSGFTVTTLSLNVFVVLKKKIRELLGNPITHGVFEMCYRSRKFENIGRPTIGIKFRNSVFEFKTERVWQKVYRSNLECLRVAKHEEANWSVIGAEPLYDVNIGYDLNNNLLYFQPMDCMSY